MIGALFFLELIVHLSMQVGAQPLEMVTGESSFNPSVFLQNKNPDIQSFKQMIYEKNKTLVQIHNADPTSTYKLEANAFAALTNSQIKQIYLGLIPSNPSSINLALKLGSAAKNKLNIIRNLKEVVTVTKNTQSQILPTPEIASRAASPQFLLAAGPPKPILIHQDMVTGRSFTSTTSVQTSKIETSTSTLEQDVATEEQLVLQIVRKYLQSKNIEPQSTINVFKSNTTSVEGEIPKPTRRLLQAVQKQLRTADTKTESLNLVVPMKPEDGKNVTIDAKLYDVDWSCLTGRVKAQGGCGACYAFATVDSVAALFAIYYYGFYAELSIQEIIDCPRNSLTFGCTGGFLQGSLGYMMQTGVLTQFSYPYTSFNSTKPFDKCKVPKANALRHTIYSFVNIPKNDCNELKTQLRKHPIGVGISAFKLTLYKQGVINKCVPGDPLDHAVVLVGFKEGKGWKIKNSWGPNWGENGYAWISPGNSCRICQTGFYPIPDTGKGLENYQKNVRVNTCPAP